MLGLKGPRFWIEHDGIVCDKRVLNMPAWLFFDALMQDFRFFQLGSFTSRTSRT